MSSRLTFFYNSHQQRPSTIIFEGANDMPVPILSQKPPSTIIFERANDAPGDGCEPSQSAEAETQCFECAGTAGTLCTVCMIGICHTSPLCAIGWGCGVFSACMAPHFL